MPSAVADNGGGEGEIGRHVQRVLGIGRHVLGDVGDDGAARQNEQAEDDDARVGAYHADDALPLAVFADRLGLAQMDRLGQAGAQPQAERQAGRAEQKGDAPAIGIERGVGHHLRKHDADQRAGGCGDFLARRLPRDGEPASARRRRFHQIGRGGSDLAAEREALHHARDDGDDRRGDADGIVGRRQRQRDDGAPHHGEAQDHRRPPARAVGIGPDHDAADRPRDEAGAERRQRQHQAGELALGGKEGVADLDGEKAVGDEIVEFEHVADGDGKRAAADESVRACLDRRSLRRLIWHRCCPQSGVYLKGIDR